jgi:Nucleotidyltransferase of unknown function (DUF6036)
MTSSVALLDVGEIKAALMALSDELRSEEQRGELLVVGGAAMALLYNARQTTKDVDVYIVAPEKAAILRKAAARVARNLNLPEDWLNDGAKVFIHNLSIGETVFEADALVVRALAPEQLLAMKLSAWRGEVDIRDASLLLGKLAGSKEEIWANVERHIVPGRETKACYAFEDLWEKNRDPAG